MYWSPFNVEINALLIELELIEDIFSNGDSWGQEIIIIEDDDMCKIFCPTAEEMTRIIFPYGEDINCDDLRILLQSSDHSNIEIGLELINSCDVWEYLDELYIMFTTHDFDYHYSLIKYQRLIILLYNIKHKF